MKQSRPRYYVSIALPMLNTERWTKGYKMFCITRDEDRETAITRARQILEGTYFEHYPLSVSNGKSWSAINYALIGEYPHPFTDKQFEARWNK